MVGLADLAWTFSAKYNSCTSLFSNIIIPFGKVLVLVGLAVQNKPQPFRGFSWLMLLMILDGDQTYQQSQSVSI